MATPYPIDELDALHEFATNAGEFFAGAFEFEEWSHPVGYESPLTERLYTFGNANGTGSELVVWRADDRPLSQQPILIFGDEGGIGVVATHTRAFLRLLTGPASHELQMFHDSDGASLWDLDDCEADEEELEFRRSRDAVHASYVSWVKDRFGIDPVATDGHEVIKAAEATWGESVARLRTLLERR